jgi:beta-aspartyl-dipeptidase (metallo-type)
MVMTKTEVPQVLQFVEFAIKTRGLNPIQVVLLNRADFNANGLPEIIAAASRLHGRPIPAPTGSNASDLILTVATCEGRKDDCAELVRALSGTHAGGVSFRKAPEPLRLHLHRDIKRVEDKTAEVSMLLPVSRHVTEEGVAAEGGKEEEEEDVLVSKGFRCTTHSDLLIAYRLLDMPEAAILPTNPSARDMLFISSPQEIKLYDFPQSRTVVLQERIPWDRDQDGMTIAMSITFSGGKILGGPTDQLLVGEKVAGIRTSGGATPEFREAVQRTAEKVISSRLPRDHLTALAGASPPLDATTLEFRSRGGKPLLHMGSSCVYGPEYFMKSFVEEHLRRPGAGNHKFLISSSTPPESLNVEVLWSRLQERDAAYNVGHAEGSTPRGIYPLVYIPGSVGTFVIVASSDVKLDKLRQLLNEIMDVADEEHQTLTEAEGLESLEGGPAETEVKHVSMAKENVRRIWCFSPAPHSPVLGQRYNLPTRFLGLMRNRKDLVVVPGGNNPTAEFVDFCSQTIGFQPWQVISTSGKSFSMDEDMDETVMAKIRAVIQAAPPGDKFVLVPYICTPNFYKWARQLLDSELNCEVGVFCETEEWTEKFGSKGILHRHIADLSKPAIIEDIDPTIQVAPGYWVSNTEQLLQAYQMLAVKDVVIKPLTGAAGVGIVFPSSVDELKLYDFRHGDVLLEKKMDLDCAQDGIVLSPALHYMKGRLVGEHTLVDQIMVGTRYMGWRESEVSPEFAQQAVTIIKKVVSYIKPSGPGGFDFLSVGGQPILSDVNTARFNGAHQPKLFADMWAPDAHWMCRKYKPAKTLDVHTFWRRLQERTIAFVPGQSQQGVFPLTHLRGLAGTYIAIGPTREACLSLCEGATKLLAPQPRRSSRVLTKSREPYEDDRGTPQLQTPGGAMPAFDDSNRRLCDLLLIKNVNIYEPEFNDEYRNILCGGGTVTALLTDEEASVMDGLLASMGGVVIDGDKCVAVPGFVDVHVHLTGGGGEAGYASRTPEVQVRDLVSGGVTTAIGVLGVDQVTRSLENLIAKVEACNEEGITAYMYTGAYQTPPPTITGDVMKDVALIKQVVGIGEVAISDHRGSSVSAAELAKIALAVRVGGMLSGCAGVTYCHIGKESTMLKPLWDAVKDHHVPITSLLPTHCQRNSDLMADAEKWCEAGGFIDLTARSPAVTKFLTDMKLRGVPMQRIMCSSDAHGSLPTFDDSGNMVRYRVADCGALLRLVKKLFFEELWSLEDALRLVTSVPADYFRFSKKGHIAGGLDADILILDRVTLELQYCICKGKVLKSPTWVKADMLEKSGTIKDGNTSKDVS